MMKNLDTHQVQNVLMEMARIVKNILESNGINYFLAYGSLLGAVRHKGFIPWDDDFDFWLLDDDYDKALTVLKKGLPNHLFLEYYDTEPLYFHSWAHIKDLNTITQCDEYPQDSFYAHKGISIDLYRLYKKNILEIEDFLFSQNNNYLERRKQKGLISECEYNKKINRKFSVENVNHDDRLVYVLVSPYKCKYLEISDVFPPKPIIFNGEPFLGPNKPDIVLTSIYGDYLLLPPEEKRKSHYSKVIQTK